LIHALRRNVDLNILLFNNKIYGLTKGQYSPTSEVGKRTKSTPYGSIDHPFNPVSVALGADASFVARVLDVDAKLMPVVLERAAAHGGASFVEILQNCSIFNDGAWADISDRKTKHATQLELQHGLPLLFDKGTKGIGLDNRMHPRVVDVEAEGLDKVLVHDETNPAMAYLLSRLTYPEFPTPMGVFLSIPRPTYDAELEAQMRHAGRKATGDGMADMQALLESGRTWEVR
ncbi:MAG: 2-oxoacid:ferredoxin oxidoreductase subunit beta, partial [Myxococcales bacterium]|nr:2-oxoacid:ferredoxin oxidoreductase subunit beta [Myxococcales bacterium]